MVRVPLLVACACVAGCDVVLGLERGMSDPAGPSVTIVSVDGPFGSIVTGETADVRGIVRGPPAASVTYELEVSAGAVMPATGAVTLDRDGMAAIGAVFGAPASPQRVTIAARADGGEPTTFEVPVLDLVTLGRDATSTQEDRTEMLRLYGVRVHVDALATVRTMGLWSSETGKQVRLAVYHGTPIAPLALAFELGPYPITGSRSEWSIESADGPYTLVPGDHWIVTQFEQDTRVGVQVGASVSSASTYEFTAPMPGNFGAAQVYGQAPSYFMIVAK